MQYSKRCGLSRFCGLQLGRTSLFTTALLAVAAGTAAAQDVDPSTGFFTEVLEVRVLEVEVFVTDRTGVPITGLGIDDFELLVDGEKMPISNFYSEAGGRVRQSVRPIESRVDSSFRPVEEVEPNPERRSHVVVLIDHTRLSHNNRKRAFRSLREAIARLDEDDLIAVVGIEGSLVFYSDFLYDREAVDRILDQASQVTVRTDIQEAERRQILGELTRGQSGGILARMSAANDQELLTRIRAYASEQYANSVNSLRNIERVINTLSGVPGRKALLYLGEGIPTRPGEGMWVEWRNRFGEGNPNAALGIRRFDFNTDYTRAVGRYDLTTSIDDLASIANGAEVTLYSVDAEGNHGGAIRSALTEQGATSETLSVVDENFRAPLEAASKATGGRLLRSSGQLSEQLSQLLGDFDTFYSLGFMPPTDWQPGSNHDIKVKAGRYQVRHRETVRLPLPDEREASATVAALRYRTADNPLEILATPGTQVPREDGTAALPVTINIPVGNLALLPEGDSHVGSLAIYVTTEAEDGRASQVQKLPFTLAIPAEKLEEARLESAYYSLPLVVRRGDRQVAIGIRDNVSGLFSAVLVDVSPYSRSL